MGKIKALIILPNWLGDAIMATPAIEDLSDYYGDIEFTFIGSYVSIEALKHHPKCTRFIVDETKKAPSRLMATYKLAKSVNNHDIAVTFRDQIHSTLLLYFSGIKQCIARKSWHSSMFLSNAIKLPRDIHLVKQYQMLSRLLTKNFEDRKLSLHVKPYRYEKPTIGINAGATYGSAKRWDSNKFAQVAAHFSESFNILIFGGPNEVEVGKEIENELISLHVTNFTNLAGKTSIYELCSHIAALDIFVTNDSGPMHIAAAYGVTTVAIFGPTRVHETSQWMNEKSVIVKKEIECAPCMKRECPLKHHECMNLITPQNVIEAVNTLL
jgi:heptosyltransferase-2